MCTKWQNQWFKDKISWDGDTMSDNDMLQFSILFETYRIMFTQHTMSMAQWNTQTKEYIFSSMPIGSSTNKSVFQNVLYRHGSIQGWVRSDYNLIAIGK